MFLLNLRLIQKSYGGGRRQEGELAGSGMNCLVSASAPGQKVSSPLPPLKPPRGLLNNPPCLFKPIFSAQKRLL